ncbi:hypothetical protein HWV23_16645 [Natronomonas halophila]|uniref:hypothetical protein n=1 Tax=Natronomonas halophila TaxID=2747817 RepID=UPI0015B71402|nr:hypothetical protein [Natronomonas halophila]QLD87281.1 hypothetical protein HWV23_16645 [Natronomonas halophila]
MVNDELTDGKRIGQLLSSEIHGYERGALGRLSVVDADTEVEPTEAGAFAYAIEYETGDGPADTKDGEPTRIAEVYVHPDRAHVEFREGVDIAAETGESEGLRVRPRAVEPPRTLVFVENGAEVKGTLRVIRTVAETLTADN